MNMKKITLLCLASLLASPAAMALQVGVTMAQMDDVFLSRLRGYIAERAKTYPDMKVQFEDAQGAVDKSLGQVQSLLMRKSTSLSLIRSILRGQRILPMRLAPRKSRSSISTVCPLIRKWAMA
jgi:hypothetical protein